MMRAEFERRVLLLFDAMLDQPAAGQLAWLHAAAAGDAALVDAVLALVAADSRFSRSLPTAPPAAPELAEPPSPPERLGNYRIVRELGRGGMGVVYLAERADGLFEQQVALKLLRHHLAGPQAAAFEAERRLLARIEHPHVARLIDGGVAPDGRPWLATEYVAGESIAADSGGRGRAANVRLFLQAAQAVAFAHARLIAHGDVKPANILVDTAGRARLLDFGVGRLLVEEGCDGGAFTPGFASPERLAGAAPSVADDVYALGRTLAALDGAALDREVAAVIARATAPETARYPAVQALIEDLEAWLARRPVQAMAGGAGYRALKFVGRHRLGVAAAALAVAGLSGSTLYAAHNYRRAEQARAAEAARFADAHRTAHYLMFTLLDRLERQPGTLRLRVQVGQVAQIYLDRLAASPGAPAEVRLDLARGYLREATLSGMGNAPNLGDVDRSVRDLDQAATVLDTLRREQPHMPGLAPPTARLYWLLCQNQIYGSGHDTAKALRLAREGEAVVATVAAEPRALAEARWPLRLCAGDALVWLNRAPAAVTLLEAELRAGRARRPLDTTMLQRNLRVLGEAYYYTNRFADAERVLLEAAAIQRAAHAQQPFYGPAVVEAANVADDLASTYGEQHRYADQLRVAQEALALVRAQAAVDRDDAQSARRALSMARLVAEPLARLGHPDRAAALMLRTDAGWAAQQRRFPDDASTARLRLLALRVTADLQRRSGQAAAACATFAATAAGWQAFLGRWHVSPSDDRENVAPVTRALATCRGGATAPAA